METSSTKQILGPISSKGDKQPKFQNDKVFYFVVVPFANHVSKIESSKSIDCTILKLLRVLVPRYGVIFTIVMLRSMLKKELYDGTISNFLTCICTGFGYIYTSALGNPKKKWILYKHLYFILQNHMFCTSTNNFIHCFGSPLSEVRLFI